MGLLSLKGSSFPTICPSVLGLSGSLLTQLRTRSRQVGGFPVMSWALVTLFKAEVRSYRLCLSVLLKIGSEREGKPWEQRSGRKVTFMIYSKWVYFVAKVFGLFFFSKLIRCY